MRGLLTLAAVLLCTSRVQAKAVFAHFMVGNAENYTLDTWETDIGLAQDAHLDAFALNVAYGDNTIANSLVLAFQAAVAKDFKLFFSFDYAGGTEPWSEPAVLALASKYILSALLTEPASFRSSDFV